MNQIDYTDTYPKWRKEMKSTHKILIPDMLPYHFALFEVALKQEGYTVETLKNTSRTVIDEGLKHVHNDTCYPCLCVVGQYIDALKSGKYDLDKTALLITQTGGGCRASNYLALTRKAIHSEFPNVPLLSLNFSGLEKDSSLPMSPRLLMKLAFCVVYGDTIMWCYNQIKPYEAVDGQTDKARDEAVKLVSERFRTGKYKNYKKINKQIIDIFAAIERKKIDKIKVGIVGEIYVKYSALGNNNLEKMLLSEGCEPIVPTLLDFVLYTVLAKVNDARMYGTNKFGGWVYKIVYNKLHKMQLKINQMFIDASLTPPHDMDHLRKCADEVINQGVKMGEGWLIPAEMAALYESGVPNIVCAQPFGCLPNHIVGKGTIRTLKKLHPDINIVAIDYDPSASSVNQENRIKLMLSAAREVDISA
ncbi:MAG: 2-hydroxyacyl-CoA dehydratase [Clostridiales bacterium]|nr:2-hydroxyacyl-CoA dehydratase [Clostridiales bacterium]